MTTQRATIRVEELLDKWRDVLDTSDDWAEKTLTTEVIEDLREVHKCLKTMS